MEGLYGSSLKVVAVISPHIPLDWLELRETRHSGQHGPAGCPWNMDCGEQPAASPPAVWGRCECTD